MLMTNKTGFVEIAVQDENGQAYFTTFKADAIIGFTQCKGGNGLSLIFDRDNAQHIPLTPEDLLKVLPDSGWMPLSVRVMDSELLEMGLDQIQNSEEETTWVRIGDVKAYTESKHPEYTDLYVSGLGLLEAKVSYDEFHQTITSK